MAKTTTLNKCECGCGGMTQRRFVPGHDAQLKSRLIKQARTGNASQRRSAATRLAKLGWTFKAA